MNAVIAFCSELMKAHYFNFSPLTSLEKYPKFFMHTDNILKLTLPETSYNIIKKKYLYALNPVVIKYNYRGKWCAYHL